MAQGNLGLLYGAGRGVTQDYKEAVKWYRLSAEQGNAEAQLYLAIMYSNGQGVLQDLVYAHMWANIAASNGDELAAEYRDRVASKMTPSQLEKAQDLARACVKKNYKGC
jgi:TPR repeat protein